VRRWRVSIQEGTTTHGISVNARNHEEAYTEALEVLGLEGRGGVGNATVRCEGDVADVCLCGAAIVDGKCSVAGCVASE
jgi:hypothetical protein